MRTKNNKLMGNILKVLLALLVVLPNHSIWGQIYTPQGSYVTVENWGEQLSPSQKLAIKQEWTAKHPRAIFLDEATTTYNCHAYAWSVSEGGAKYWMNTPNDDIYMTDGSYVLTNSTDPKATKVSYTSDDHSAVVSYGGYLISKWGSLCLMKHTPRDCPYNSNTLSYYKLSMEITGNDVIALQNTTSTVTESYTLTNLPDDATVNWTVTGQGSIASGQGSSTINVSFNGTGNTIIAAKVYCSTGLVVNIPFNLYVNASSAPITTDIEMFKYCQGTGEFTLKAHTNQPEGTFTWTIFGGNAELYDIPYPDDASFMSEPNTYKAVRFYETGTYTISVTGSKAGTTDIYTYSKDFYVTEVVSNN